MSAPDLVSFHSHISSSSPNEEQQGFNVMDSEMTYPLTSIDESRSRLQSPSRMSSYQSGLSGSSGLPSRPNQPFRSITTPGPNNNSAWNDDTRMRGPPRSTPDTNFPPYTSSTGFENFEGSQYGQPAQHGQHIQHGPHGPPSQHSNYFPGHVLLSSISPGPVYPSEPQLNTAFGYGIRLADGTYTRLVRADQLAGGYYNSIPTHQGPEGLIIVPEPRQPSPSRRTGQMPLVPKDVS